MRALSIRSKILLMLIVSGLLCIVAVGFFADRSGRRSLTTSATDQLTQLRAIQQRTVDRQFTFQANIARTLAEMPVMNEGVVGFAAAFADFDNNKDAEAITAELSKWYQREFLPALAPLSEGMPQIGAYMPSGFAGRRLQRDYIVRNPHSSDEGEKLDSAGTGTFYDLLHATIHPTIRRLAERHGFDDVLLVEARNGNVVYNLSKQVDLGVDLKSGPAAQTGAGRAFQRALQARDPGSVVIEDFSPYAPDLLRPTAFLSAPLFRQGELAGVLILQTSAKVLNALMTNRGRWEEIGLGKTGEVYLVGNDGLMRSDSRFVVEDPKAFLALQRQRGETDANLRRMEFYNSSILLQKVDSDAVRAALRGDSGTGIYKDYRGEEVIGSWAPINVGGVRWAIMAEQDAAEALAPVSAFRRTLALIAAVAILLLTLASLIAAGILAAPLRRMLGVAERLAGGDDKARIRDPANDEFGALARGFNRMADSLTERQAAVEAKTRDYENLLRNVYPEIIADRLRKGETAISESISNVSLIVIAIDGLDTVPANDAPGSALGRLNAVVDALDDAAVRHGVEKIKTLGETYTAACGLSVARLDHARRALAFCAEAAAALTVLSHSWEDDLTIRASVVSGDVEAGLVGRHRTVYDIWGPNFLLARRIVFDTQQGHVRVIEATRDLVPEIADFTAMPPLLLPNHPPLVTWQRPLLGADAQAEAA